MVARKSAAPAKKAVKKTAPVASSRGRASTTKTAPSTPAKKSAEKEQTTGEKIAQAILDGHLDGDLVAIDDALEKRANAQAKIAAKKSASKPAAKKVAAPPKKSAPVKTVEPVKDTTYQISSRLKSLAGAKVKFLRFKADTDGAKSVVEMLVDKPGNPKGKRVSVPTTALEAVKAAARKSAKK